MELLTYQNGRVKLARNGYLYTVRYSGVSRRQWQCTKKSSTGCSGSASTSLQNDDVRDGRPHNHAPNQAEVDAATARVTMANRAATGGDMPAVIVAEEAVGLNAATMAALPRLEYIKRSLRNERRDNNIPANPNTLVQLGDIPQRYAQVNGENFVIFDSGANTPDRIILFGTQQMIRGMAGARRWYCDGNFALAPRCFRQIYTIRFERNEHFFTGICALLPTKTRATYERLFEAVVQFCQVQGINITVTEVKMDFEDAAMRAAAAVLGRNVRISGCFYHLTQSTWRHIQSLGLVQDYRTNDDFRLTCAMLDGLAFLPLADVAAGMGHIRQVSPQLAQPLIEYFDETYVSGRLAARPGNGPGINVVLRRSPPLFPPNTWNTHDNTVANTPRTNNVCEGFNNSLRNLAGHHHPSVWKVIEIFQKNLGKDRLILTQLEAGIAQPRRTKQKFIRLQNRLRQLCVNYTLGQHDLPYFMRAIGHCVHQTKRI